MPQSQPKIFHYLSFYGFASCSERTWLFLNIRECFEIYMSIAIFFVFCPKVDSLVKRRRKLSSKLGRMVFFPHKMSKTWKFSDFLYGNWKKWIKEELFLGKNWVGVNKCYKLQKWIPSRPEAPKRLGGGIYQIDNFRAPAAAKKRPQLSWNFAWSPNSSVSSRKSTEGVKKMNFKKFSAP